MHSSATQLVINLAHLTHMSYIEHPGKWGNKPIITTGSSSLNSFLQDLNDLNHYGIENNIWSFMQTFVQKKIQSARAA